MRLNIVHATQYSYDEPVAYGLQRLRKTPPDRPGQAIVSWTRSIEGAREEASYKDHHGNLTQLISIAPGTTEIRIECGGVVETSDTSGVVGAHGQHPPLWLFQRDTVLTARTPQIRELARAAGDGDDIARLHRLMGEVADRVSYVVGTTEVTTTADEALQRGSGVCQDHSHIFIAAARMLGLPARYVSGLLMLDDRQAQSASHAWAEVHVDALGWVGFDVSNRIAPDERYVCLATGLDYREAAPVSGFRHGSAVESLAVEVVVEQ